MENYRETREDGRFLCFFYAPAHFCTCIHMISPPESGYDLSPLWISNAADLRYSWGRMEGQSDLVAAIIEFEEFMLALFLAESVP